MTQPETAPFHVEDLPGEEWRSIKGFEGRYEVSNLGRVKSKARLVHHGYLHHGTTNKGETVLRTKLRLNSNNSICASVSLHDGEGTTARKTSWKYYGVSRLVWEAFVEELPNSWKFVIRFKDGDGSNCALSNLYKMTRAELLAEVSINNLR